MTRMFLAIRREDFPPEGTHRTCATRGAAARRRHDDTTEGAKRNGATGCLGLTPEPQGAPWGARATAAGERESNSRTPVDGRRPENLSGRRSVDRAHSLGTRLAESGRRGQSSEGHALCKAIFPQQLPDVSGATTRRPQPQIGQRPRHTFPRYRCSLPGLAGFTLPRRQGARAPARGTTGSKCSLLQVRRRGGNARSLPRACRRVVGASTVGGRAPS
jgi:hypothetical protein